VRRKPLEERDLRSLQRRSMYSIFGKLDPEEPLPRELLVEAHRHRYFSIKRMEVAAYLYLPALILVLIVMFSLDVNALVAFGVAGALLAGFFIYAMIGEYR
jgi:hypothetical protein